MKAWVKIILIFDRELAYVETRSILLRTIFIEFVTTYVDEICKSGIEQFNLQRFCRFIISSFPGVILRVDQHSIFLTLEHVAELDLL